MVLPMKIAVEAGEAKANFDRLLQQAHEGDEIILAKAGRPYARLMPLASSPQFGLRRPGRIAGKLDDQFFAPLPADELREWENSATVSD